jgi:quinol monooxygenase YgiN
MIKVVAKSAMQKDKVPEALKILEELVAKTRQENGCIAYEVFETVNDPTVLAFFEEWESQAHLDAHIQSEHFKALFPELNKCCAGPFDITVYQKKL